MVNPGIHYAPEPCGFCGGSGNDLGLDCEVCGGQGSILVAQPSRHCSSCHGSGREVGDIFCEACGGTGWAYSLSGMSNLPPVALSEKERLIQSMNRSMNRMRREWRMQDEGATSTSRETASLEVLKLRYAKGEITKEQYEQMKKDLSE